MTKFTRLLIATTNEGKLGEIRETLKDLPIRLLSLGDFPGLPAPDETEPTFIGNAKTKALYYAGRSGELTVADDSGLEIDALAGAPGVESARFGGPGRSYPEKFELLFELLRQSGTEDRSARFVCAVVLAEPDRVLFETQATVDGRIAPEARGTGGFGYDPIFFYPPFGCTLAEAGDRKSDVSHRGKAFRHLCSWLSSHFLRSSPPP
jgi:XTP/dITP diphosphohydrolase